MKWDIYLIKLPRSDGNEQFGSRPCIILREFKTGSIIIPMTSNPDALRFPYTLEIEKSKINGLSGNSMAMVFQIRYVDRQRLVKKIGELDYRYRKYIGALIEDMLLEKKADTPFKNS